MKAASTDSAADSTEKSTTVDVTVEVTNVDEDGEVTLSASQPRIGVEIRANMPTDLDGGVTDVTWQWSSGDQADGSDAMKIKDATMAGYTPVTADDNKYLRVTASYTDAEGSGKTAIGMPAGPNAMVQKVRNLAPVFNDEDADTDGIQIDPRAVAENSDENTQVNTAAAPTTPAPVAATDTADAETGDNTSILYLLSGADAASFDIDSDGQITVGASAMLDHETKDTYMVTVTARDPEGLNSSVDVTIMVTDVNEPPVFGEVQEPDAEPTNNAPAFAADTDTREVAENTAAGEDIGAPVEATDDDAGDMLTYTLGGDDAVSFDIDPATGQIMTKAALDRETKSTYSVTVTASDSGGLSASIDVTIMVTDVDEAPDVAGEASIEYEENATSTVAMYTAVDPESAEIVWSLGGDDAALFSIDGGVLTFVSAPDYEAPADMGGDNVYQVTVGANDGTTDTDTQDVTVTVTDVDDAVTSGDSLVDRYDANNDGTIEKSEVLKAINDYLFGEGDEAISKTEVLRLINIYLFE